ncbi:MAG: cytochrome P450 [Pseudomonadota bacterium]
MNTDDGLPPGLDSPPWVQTLRFVARPLEFLDECHDKLGEIFTLKLAGLGNWVLLSSPSDLKTLFTGPPETLHAGEANRRVFGAILGDSTVVTLDEGAHLQRRRLLSPPFHGEAIKQHVDAMTGIAGAAAESWPMGRPFSLRHALQQISLDVIRRVMFGVKQTPEQYQLGKSVIDLANMAASPLMLMPRLQWDFGRYSPWGRIVRVIRHADIGIYREIARRRCFSQDENQHDLFSLLLRTRYEDGRYLSDRELRDELVTMLLAGHETTATAMAWTFERILSNPKILEKVLEELGALGCGQLIEAETVPKLEYLDAIIKETHRLRPIMPIGGSRRVTAPFEVGGYRIPPGTIVTNCMFLLHKRPDLYPDPGKFMPERFFGKKPDPCEWTPFGGGIRRCLGMAFAATEMKVVLATVLSRVRLQIENPNAKIRRRGFFLVPDGGPRVCVVDRK